MKRTYQPSKLVRKRRHGFRSRMSTRGGRKLLARRRAKGRKRLSTQPRMIKFESLKKNSHFEKVLRNRVINNDLVSIYRVKNFIKKRDNRKKLYISFVIRKKVGNAVKRNRIKRKLKSIIQKLLKINSAINSNYTYIIFGKTKVYDEQSSSLFEKIKRSFLGMKG